MLLALMKEAVHWNSLPILPLLGGTWFTTTHPPSFPVSYITFYMRHLSSNLGPKKLASPRNTYFISQGPSGSRWHPQNRIILGEFIYNGAVYKGVDDHSCVISPGWKEEGSRGYHNPGGEKARDGGMTCTWDDSQLTATWPWRMRGRWLALPHSPLTSDLVPDLVEWTQLEAGGHRNLPVWSTRLHFPGQRMSQGRAESRSDAIKGRCLASLIVSIWLMVFPFSRCLPGSSEPNKRIVYSNYVSLWLRFDFGP